MKRRLSLAAASAAVVLALSACGGKGADASASPAAAGSAALAVGLVQVAAAPIMDAVTVSGQVAAWQEMPLGVELSGLRVAEVRVEVGARVRRGDVLLTLDARTLDSELQVAEAAANEARAGVLLAKTQLDRGDALKAQKLISLSDHDQLRAAMVQAEARAQTTAAQLDAARLRRDFAVLRAPADGVIASRQAEPGLVVGAGATLLGLIRDGRLEWRAELDESDLLRVRPGAEVAVRVRDGSEVAGRVRAVTPVLARETRTATVYVDLPEPGGLRAGMFAEGRIRLGSDEVLQVPLSAVVRRDGYAYVFVLKGRDQVERRRVELGRIDGEQVEVRTGLAAGERVVRSGGAFLADGDRVRIADGD